MKKYLFIVVLSLCLSAQAAIYECVQNGKTVYTNKKSGDCKSAGLGFVGTYSSDKSAYSGVYLDDASSYSRGSSSGGKSSSSTTRRPTRSGTAAEHVPSSTQAKRDTGRLGILQRELANEQQALNTAIRNLAAGKAEKKTPAQLEALEGAVKDRQENISALQKEISRM